MTVEDVAALDNALLRIAHEGNSREAVMALVDAAADLVGAVHQASKGCTCDWTGINVAVGDTHTLQCKRRNHPPKRGVL